LGPISSQNMFFSFCGESGLPAVQYPEKWESHHQVELWRVSDDGPFKPLANHVSNNGSPPNRGSSIAKTNRGGLVPADLGYDVAHASSSKFDKNLSNLSHPGRLLRVMEISHVLRLLRPNVQFS
jgi:hypothetical protein